MKKMWWVLVFAVVLSLGLSAVAWGNELAPGVIFAENFEDGTEELPEGWTVFTLGSQKRTTDVAYKGKYSFLLDDPDNKRGVGLRSPYTPIEAGKDYQATAWVLVESGSVQFYLEFWDERQTTRLAAPWVGVSKPAQGEWQRAVSRVTAPEGAKYVSLILYSAQGTISRSYFDDIKIIDVAAYQ